MAKPQETHKTRQNNNSKTLKQSSTYLKYTHLAIQLVLTLAVAGGIGYWIDRWLEWRIPVFTLVFVILAFAGVMYQLIKTLR